MLIDTHCHLASSHFIGVSHQEIIGRAHEAGVGKMVTLGSCVGDWEETLSWAGDFPGSVFPCLGIHPNDAHEAPDDWRNMLKAHALRYRLAAIGEVGLDYYHPVPEGMEEDAYKRQQHKLLEAHFELALELGLNIVLHTRDRKGTASFDDAMAIARPYAGKVKPVFHCFIGTREQASRVFDELDGLVSITGIATFKNPGHVAEVVAWCPAGRYMLETDSPYLSPVPKRGRTNEPAYLSYLAECVAGLRGTPLDEVARTTLETAGGFFRL